MRCAAVCLIAMAALSGCAEPGADDRAAKELPRPLLLATSTSLVSVGQALDFLGGNFVNTRKSHAEVRFRGNYSAFDGTVTPIDFRMQPNWADGNRLTWPNVGPFTVPFSPSGDQLGT